MVLEEPAARGDAELDDMRLLMDTQREMLKRSLAMINQRCGEREARASRCVCQFNHLWKGALASIVVLQLQVPRRFTLA